MSTKSSSRQKWLYGTIGLSVMLCIVVLSFNGLKAKAADLKEMIQSELLPTDSIKKSTPTVIRIRKVAENNNETVTPQIIVRDTVARDTKIKIRTSQNEDIRVVGYGTLNGAKPLIIVDGLESSEDINPKDVDRVQVLKDASATKLYGEKGKNGVILVTTRKKFPKTAIDESKIIIGPPGDEEWHKNQPAILIFVDGKEMSMNDVKVENIESLSVNRDFATIRDSMKVIKDTAMISKFIKPGISGVISIKMKKK